MLKLKRINTTQWPKAANVSKEFRRSSLYCIANCDAEMCTKFACKREIIEVSIRIFLLKFSLPVHFIQERKKEEDFFCCSVNVNIFMSYLLKKSFEVSSVGTSFICHVLSSMECKIHMAYVSIAFEGLKIDIFWTFFASTKISQNCTSQCSKITQNVSLEYWHFPPIFDLLKNWPVW